MVNILYEYYTGVSHPVFHIFGGDWGTKVD
jgi:hypothetical protein